MKLLVVAVGKLRDRWAAEGCAEYLDRLRHYLPVEVVELKEGAPFAVRVPERYRVVALDERGDQVTSVELAERLRRWQVGGGLAGVALLIGGADGLPADVVRRADERLALSRLTLPHRLARLVLLEQLYRAATILRGEPYHRA